MCIRDSSYFFDCNENSHIVAQVDYGIPINAIVVKDNIIGMQFHPEKSQKTGLDLISNFLLWGK